MRKDSGRTAVAWGVVFASWFSLGFLMACGSASVMPERWPDAPETRVESLLELGQSVFEAAHFQRPATLLASDRDLSRLVHEDSAAALAPARAAVRGGPIGATPGAPRGALAQPPRFVSACIQQSRVEEAGGQLGLVQPGWVVERVLVEGRRSDGARVGAWAEGAFLYTSKGFVGLSLSRLEPLRWEHADLELATCDQRVQASTTAQDQASGSPLEGSRNGSKAFPAETTY